MIDLSLHSSRVVGCERLAGAAALEALSYRPPGNPELIAADFRDLKGFVGNRDQYTHLMHWYPAKMFYRIPRLILENLQRSRPTTVFDPFCGSGSVLVEALVAGDRPIGLDVNPLARLLSKAKTTPIPPGRLEACRTAIRVRLSSSPRPQRWIPDFDGLEYWFRPPVIEGLSRIAAAVHELQDGDCRDLASVSLSATVRQVSNADPEVGPPVRMRWERAHRARSRYRRRLRFVESLDERGVIEVFLGRLGDNTERIHRLWRVVGKRRARILADGEAANTGLAPSCVDVIITSPPYAGAQKYVRSLSLEMAWLGYSREAQAEIDRKTLGSERVRKGDWQKRLWSGDSRVDELLAGVYDDYPERGHILASYLRYLKDFSRECLRIIRPDGDVFVVLGINHVVGRRIPVDEIFAEFAKETGFCLVGTLVDRIPSRLLLTRRHPTAKNIPDERIMWLRPVLK